MRFCRLAVALAVAAFPLAAAEAATAPTRAFSRQGIAFRYPAAWKVSPSGWAWASAAGDSALAWLSAQPMRRPCVTTGDTTTCGPALDVVRPGGVLVTVGDLGPNGRRRFTTPVVRIAGRDAHVVTARPGACRDVHADETITAYIPRGHGDLTTVTACLRRPRAANERRVHALLATLRVR